MRAGRGILSMLTVAALFLAAAVVLQARRDRAFGTDVPAAQVLYVQSPEVAGRLALSFDALAADVYWIRALQHFGSARRVTEQEQELRAALPAARHGDGARPQVQHRLSLRLDLPGRAETAGAPAGPISPSSSWRRACRRRRRNGRYMQDAGFVHFWALRDYKGAAAWFERGSKVPGAAWFLKPLAATTLAQGGQRSASRTLFTAIAESGENDWMRKDALRRLRQLDAMDAMDELRQTVAAYRQRGGSPPLTWPALVRAGYLRAIPTDPDGVVFALGPWSGDVSLGEGSKLAPLPDAPTVPPAVPPS